jgi:hypothetical protein
MTGNRRTPSLGATAAVGILVDPAIRSAALDAIPPLTRLAYAVLRRRLRVQARRRVAPAMAAGAGALTLGAATVYLSDPRHRHRLQRLMVR